MGGEDDDAGGRTPAVGWSSSTAALPAAEVQEIEVVGDADVDPPEPLGEASQSLRGR
jgi:hypothetical protein